MTQTLTAKLSPSCRIEVNLWDSFSPDASVIYTEHGDGWGGSHGTDCQITPEEALVVIEILKQFVNYKPKG